MLLTDEPPPMTRKASSRAYPEIADMVLTLKAAHSEYDRAQTLSHAMYLLDPDELAVMTSLVIDRLQAGIPEEWR